MVRPVTKNDRFWNANPPILFAQERDTATGAYIDSYIDSCTSIQPFHQSERGLDVKLEARSDTKKKIASVRRVITRTDLSSDLARTPAASN